MKIVQQTLEGISDVKTSFFTGVIDVPAKDKLLVIVFESNSPVTREDITYMNAMKLAGSEIWSPSAIILDLRKLHYGAGDTMAFLFKSPYPPVQSQLQKIFEGEQKRSFQIIAVISDACRKGMTSLVSLEMSMNPSTLLFESIEEAIGAIQCRFEG